MNPARAVSGVLRRTILIGEQKLQANEQGASGGLTPWGGRGRTPR